MPSTAPRPPGRGETPADTGTDYPRDALLPDLFTAQAVRSPDRAALVWSDGHWTFRELHDRVRCAAAGLRARGVAAGDIVAVLLESSPQWVVTALAVLEAGAVYLPLDPRTPARRLATMLGDASPACLVTAPDTPAHPSLPPLLRVTTDDLGDGKADLEDGKADLGDGKADLEDCEVLRRERPRSAGRTATDAAYLVYTSGSTGTPKGVLCSHRGLVRFVTADHPAVPRPGDRLLATANPTFDVSCYEIFCTLLNGACLVLPEPEDLLDTGTLARRLRQHRITTLWLSAGLFHVHAQAAPHMFAGLRCLMVGGDSVGPGAVRAVLAQGPPGTLVNGYGPTENTVISTSHVVRELPEHAELVPIGTPVPATTVHVLRPDGTPAGAGEEGELWLGGDGVALGYLNDPQRTAERFLPDPFGDDTQARLYRTGDMVRRRADGVLEFLGRRDRQVKLRGFRVELDEVEAVLSSHPGVREVAVGVLGEGPGKHLGAVVVRSPRTDAATLVTRLSDHVRDRLPAHMVPSRVVCVSELPLTTSGKADRARLLARLDRSEDASPGRRAPEGADETTVARIWCDLLGADAVARDDDFFVLGGTSLTAAQAATAVRHGFGLGPEHGSALVRELLGARTLAAFTERIRALAARGAAPAPGGTPDPRAEARLRWTPSFAGPRPRAGALGRVFVTGAGGFLGVHLVDRLLRAGAERVYCLTRTPDAARGAARVAARMRRFGVDPRGPDDRVTVIPGDLAAERFGLDKTAWDRLAAGCDLIVHCGALVNLAYPYEALAPVNVGGTRTVIELATADRLKPVHHISALGTDAGSGPAGVRRTTGRAPQSRPGPLPLGYLQTKWVAEELVRDAVRQGLPGTVHCPAQIAGTRDRGVWNTDTLMCALFRTIAESGTAPRTPLALDLVPVDYTAERIVRTITDAGPDGRLHHIANPRAGQLPLLVDRLRAMRYDVRTVPYPEWAEAVGRATKADPRHPMAPYLPLFTAPLPDTGTTLAQAYFTARPHPGRTGAGHPPATAGPACPPVDDRLIDLYLGRLRATGYLPPPDPGGTPAP
ncbi:amino acid adenylation domain-containing protein [Streptomyces sp. NPDC017095]|uniref:amino acid adenylation domain-containing protein n=1 Tax=Streptomyces sp. NPDC017095 TaxID=3364977 RepID=UPI00378FA64A